ncbi:MAG: hypothetical protein NZM27_10945 [Acetobacteraceae bacterium]|nr:hypothetical protein [Acetobacteraceae bacterium]MDW8398650.1 hypothetical protein [Acetobacteraceae bacterium]
MTKGQWAGCLAGAAAAALLAEAVWSGVRSVGRAFAEASPLGKVAAVAGVAAVALWLCDDIKAGPKGSPRA